MGRVEIEQKNNSLSKQGIVTQGTSLKEAWEKVLSEVREAAAGARHPFRYVTLATVDKSNWPHQRTVVLRDFANGSEFSVFTDCRSEKVDQINQNESVSLLFYHDEKKLQLRVLGTARILQKGEEVDRIWRDSISKNPEPYTSVIPPGTTIENPEKAYRWDLEGTPNFCILKIRAASMEFLQLDGAKHIRGGKKMIQGENDTAYWIAP